MRSRLSVLLVLSALVGCGAPTFAGLGEEFDASVDFDTSNGDTELPGGDSLFPLEETGEDGSAPTDATIDPPDVLDASDAVAVDASDTPASDVVVEAALDGATDGTVEADVSIADGDATVADSTSLDGATLDTAVSPETGIDTSVVDSGTTDGIVSPIDTGTPDTGTPDTGGGPLGATPMKVNCYDSDKSTSASCTAPGNVCCGFIPFGSFSWHWACRSEGSCGWTERSYHCDDKSDCTGTRICCASRNITGTINGGECRESCGSDPQLCRQTSECGGKTCVPQNAPDSPWTIGVCK